MNEPRYYLSHDPLPGIKPEAPKGRKWRKDVLHVGTYQHPTHGWSLQITPDRLQRMADTFQAMQKNGVTTDVTVDHSTSARDKLGKVIGAAVEGGVLYLDHELADDDAEQIAARNQEVSVEIEPELTDGKGNTYTDALVASSIVRQPVVPNQGPFVRIAAGRTAKGKQDDEDGDSTATGLPFHLSAEPKPRRRSRKPKDHTMQITDKQHKKLLSLTGLDDKADDAKVAESVVALAEKGKGAEDQAKTIEELEAERDKLNEQIASLEKDKGGPTPDPDVMEETAENREAELKRLVEDGKITPAVGEKLAASLLGTPGKRPALCLSRAAATHAGLPGPIAKTLLEILEGNNPVDLKPKTGPQTLSLGRHAPGSPETKPDPETQDRMAKTANFGQASA